MMGIDFQGLRIGPGQRCFIIAEAGVNHNGDLDRALALVDAAALCGADAVKFQTFVSEELIVRHGPKARYHIETTGSDEEQSWFALLKSQELSAEAFAALKHRCQERGIEFMSTPYDVTSVRLLDSLDVKSFKVASTDTNNHPLLVAMAATGRPVILSTGMCTMAEVAASVAALRAAGCTQLVLTQCTADYPAPIAEANLRAMVRMGEDLGVAVGYSDHVPGSVAALGAVALGACLYERHFTLDCTLPGPDHRASMEPGPFAALVADIRALESALGDGIKRVMPSESANRPILRKHVIARHAIAAGAVVTEADLTVKRTGGAGVTPDRLGSLIGCRLVRAVVADEPITEDLIASAQS